LSKFIKAAPAVIIIVALALILMLGRNILDSKLPALGGNYYKDSNPMRNSNTNTPRRETLTWTTIPLRK